MCQYGQHVRIGGKSVHIGRKVSVLAHPKIIVVIHLHTYTTVYSYTLSMYTLTHSLTLTLLSQKPLCVVALVIYGIACYLEN